MYVSGTSQKNLGHSGFENKESCIFRGDLSEPYVRTDVEHLIAHLNITSISLVQSISMFRIGDSTAGICFCHSETVAGVALRS